jgi:hypothetical protein
MILLHWHAYSAIMALLLLSFPYLFTFDLSKMALHWCNASPDSSFFASNFQVHFLNTLFIAFLCRQSLATHPLASFQYVLCPFGNQVHQT